MVPKTATDQEVTRMPMNPELKQCRDDCQTVANQIRTIANSIVDQRSKEMLTLGAAHLEKCIHQCDQALVTP